MEFGGQIVHNVRHQIQEITMKNQLLKTLIISLIGLVQLVPLKAAEIPDSKSQKIRQVFHSELLLRANADISGTLLYGTLQAMRAKSPEAVNQAFAEAQENGRAKSWIGIEDLREYVKATESKIDGGYQSKLVVLSKFLDIGEQVGKYISSKSKVHLSEIPRPEIDHLILARWDGLPPAVRRQIENVLSQKLNLKLEDIEQRVREQSKSLKNSIDQGEAGRKIYNEIINKIKEEISNEKEAFANSVKAPQHEVDTQENKINHLKNKVEQYQAAIYLTSVSAGQVFGHEVGNQVATVGTGFVQMYSTLKQFGPGGLTPDKLLLSANWISAGLMIVSAFGQQTDPTMEALKEVMQQMQQLFDMLDRLNGNVEDLSNMVVLGFDRVLQNQNYQRIRMNDVESLILRNTKNQNQMSLMQSHLNAIKTKRKNYDLAYKCTGTPKYAINPADCIQGLVKSFSKENILTATSGDLVPEVVSQEWSNQLLNTANDVSTDSILLELSAPALFSADLQNLNGMIALNHELVSALLEKTIGVQKRETIPNPDILRARLDILLKAAKNRKLFRARDMIQITEQATARVNELENFLAQNFQNPEVFQKLAKAMEHDLSQYENNLKEIFSQFKEYSYAAEKAAFLSRPLRSCDKKRNFPAIGFPFDAKSKKSLEFFIPQEYWIAQELNMGTIGVCYDALAHDKKIARGPVYYQVNFKIKIFFNPPVKINSAFTKVVDATQTQFEMQDGAYIIDERVVSTPQHYTTYYGYDRDVFPRSWIAKAEHNSDMLECRDQSPLKSPLCGHDIKSRKSAKDIFINESTSLLPIESKNRTRKLFQDQISTFVSQLILSQTKMWNPRSLVFEKAKLPESFPDRLHIDEWQISLDFERYTLKFYLAQNMLMTAHYHNNIVSESIQTLQKFEPSQITKVIRNLIFETNNRKANAICIEFEEKISSIIPNFQKIKMHPELKIMKNELLKLHDLQLKSL
jgi:hypothetical protein